ncbi:MAG: hypothetical protein QNJ63_21190 [Calothrix sp. MO_192.B10]|nr:hypothetical protein [Calothrix sp. MO_192.B10]
MLSINIFDMAQGLPNFHHISLALALTYLLVSCYFMINWLIFSIRNPSSIPEEKFLSVVMFAMTTLLWPLGIITSFVQIVKTKKIKLSIAIACLITLFIFSIMAYLL